MLSWLFQRRQGTHSIDVVVPTLFGEMYGTMQADIRDVLGDTYTLLSGSAEYDSRAERHILERLSNRMVDGLVVVSNGGDEVLETLKGLARTGVPLVQVDDSHPCAGADGGEEGLLAVRRADGPARRRGDDPRQLPAPAGPLDHRRQPRLQRRRAVHAIPHAAPSDHDPEEEKAVLWTSEDRRTLVLFAYEAMSHPLPENVAAVRDVTSGKGVATTAALVTEPWHTYLIQLSQ